MGGAELIGGEEKDAIAEVIDRGAVLFRYGFDKQRHSIYKVSEFEKKFAEYSGVRYALGASSGTAALRIALAALGIRRGDEVIMPAFTFVATAEAIIESGATPVIAEIDSSLNLNPDDFENKITEKTKAVVPVHMLGVAAKMDRVMEIAKKHRLRVLEDAAQACGSSFRGKKVGTIGDIGIYSFDYVKTITTGEGGMLVTNDEDLYLKASSFHDHGHEHQTDVPRGKDLRREHGFNFRMSELQGAMGIVQLGRLDYVISEQIKNKESIKEAIKEIRAIRFRELPDAAGDGGDTLVFFLPNKGMASNFEEGLTQEGIGTKILPSALNWHYVAYWDHIRLKIKNPNATWPSTDSILRQAIAIPISVKMAEAEIEKIISAVKRVAGDVLL
ncbi:DegT/DnrJ/EryC1/StrS family aminotransferase [candidate division NPL-UPA2 bacterium Unc8]|uniref:DegT/DnrJ/EryC1/StrS family aminotransferase n=1 Tax=candidate division NPL-UPA2 bacterium Unc8 TaxID=1980939 RepID=A0A399FZK4_UNCN2|nr:8-amino-3,8-dideoxy-alpha-D-manno-octulosonate transaminase [Bacillota bacterium]MBT9146327.1 8-amino-3,8-dideoxy-alpha-D-manno-octulosonate transaminase [Bacillota bacterium]RII00692.1 MAG: DegT/DnrJ/EryC1/StrS family aminotransferase [candidate division NPL-UPA2 bacterium Unc8]